MASRRTAGRAAYGAAAWAFLFAAVSFYWAAGGDLGLTTLSRGLREKALERDPAFVALVWMTGGLKVLAGLLALALARPGGRARLRRLLLVAGWATGSLLVLYGGVGLVSAALAELGITSAEDPAALRWYLLLWEPLWLVGGGLFLAAAYQYARATGREPFRGAGRVGGLWRTSRAR